MGQDFLIQSTLSERLNTKGIVTMRADMIVLSVIFINFVLREFDIKEMIRSKYALKKVLCTTIFKGNLQPFARQ